MIKIRPLLCSGPTVSLGWRWGFFVSVEAFATLTSLQRPTPPRIRTRPPVQRQMMPSRKPTSVYGEAQRMARSWTGRLRFDGLGMA
jgi:hypothetical protein